VSSLWTKDRSLVACQRSLVACATEPSEVCGGGTPDRVVDGRLCSCDDDPGGTPPVVLLSDVPTYTVAKINGTCWEFAPIFARDRTPSDFPVIPSETFATCGACCTEQEPGWDCGPGCDKCCGWDEACGFKLGEAYTIRATFSGHFETAYSSVLGLYTRIDDWSLTAELQAGMADCSKSVPVIAASWIRQNYVGGQYVTQDRSDRISANVGVAVGTIVDAQGQNTAGLRPSVTQSTLPIPAIDVDFAEQITGPYNPAGQIEYESYQINYSCRRFLGRYNVWADNNPESFEMNVTASIDGPGCGETRGPESSASKTARLPMPAEVQAIIQQQMNGGGCEGCGQ
jgi:hypothetical protein